jgi:hypothetical protein
MGTAVPMNLRLITLRYDEGLRGFPEEALTAACAGLCRSSGLQPPNLCGLRKHRAATATPAKSAGLLGAGRRFVKVRILESARWKLAMPMACVHFVPMKITLEFEEKAFASLRRGPEEFARELRLAARVKWYELGQISQASRA